MFNKEQKRLSKQKKAIEFEEDILEELESKARLRSIDVIENQPCHVCGIILNDGKHGDAVVCIFCNTINYISNPAILTYKKKIDLQRVVIQNEVFKYKKMLLRHEKNKLEKELYN